LVDVHSEKCPLTQGEVAKSVLVSIYAWVTDLSFKHNRDSMTPNLAEVVFAALSMAKKMLALATGSHLRM
jgi:hypothetical protein